MRILLLVFNLTGKGTYWRALNFGRCLVQRGHTVTLVSTSPQERFKILERDLDGIRLVEAPDLLPGSLRSGWDLWNSLSRILHLRTAEYDLVHAFENRPTVYLPAAYFRSRNVPFISDWADWFGRGGSVEERFNPFMRAVLRPVETYFEENRRRKAGYITAICSILEQKAIQLGFPPEKVLRLPNGCDTAAHPIIDAAQARQLANLPLEGCLIGFVGTIFKRDALLMAQAFDRLQAQLPGAHLLVAGYCPTDINRLVQHPEGVIQTGPMDQKALNLSLAACDLFWLPLCDTNANRGRWPLKLNDYMAAGRPVVATPVGDVTALLQSEEIGLLAAPHPEPFAAASLSLYADPYRRGTMGRHARKLAETVFQWEALTGQLLSFYQRILPSL